MTRLRRDRPIIELIGTLVPRSLKEWLKPPRHLLVLFLAVVVLLTATLVWLSWQLVRQDRALAGQRLEERREAAAELAVAALEKSLLEVEERLSALSRLPAGEAAAEAYTYAAGLAGDSALVLLRAGHLEAFPAGRVVFYPIRAGAPSVPASTFAGVETLEFLREDYPRALAGLRPLVRSSDPLIRAGALLRLARVLRKSGQGREALATCEDLAKLGTVPVEGLPAELVARQARLALLERLERREELAREASALYRDLQTGRWRLTRAEYGFYLEEALRRLGGAGPREGLESAMARASAVEFLWTAWQAIRQGEGDPQGRRLEWFSAQPLLVLWRASSETLAALVAGPGLVESRWLAAVRPMVRGHGVRIALTGTDGRAVAGQAEAEPSRQALRLASVTHLPWNLHAITVDAGAELASSAARRRVLLSGLSLVAVLTLAGGYFAWRAMSRELAVSRLQSDFVSAVSHEFRTPLTALRQLSELLVSGRVAGEQDRQEYYELIAHESQRLGRLVEGLLNFGRVEAGALEFRFEAVDPAALVREVVQEFRRESGTRGYQVELTADGPAPPVRADRAGLSCVVWNLLDNAVKYSPESFTVWVEVEREGPWIVIRVRDRGLGIPPGEQTEIFRKFVRGQAARARSILGTGIGLAVASQIVAAHGGNITLQSRPGEGSTFTVRLPITD